MIHAARNEIVVIENLPPQGAYIELDAGEAERAAIAMRLRVAGVSRLHGAFDVTRTLGEVAVSGAIAAVVQRECVASLEVFDETISETFEIAFVRDPARGAEVEIDEVTPEPLNGDTIDLGEILIQQLALAMDPYPRKPGARSLAEAFAPEEKVSPFAGLKAEFDKRRDRE